MVDSRIQLALTHQKAGRFAEAQNLYRQILTENTQHPAALNYFGVLAIQTGQLPLAVRLLERAVAANPVDATAYCNLGEALRQSGQAQPAIESFRKAIVLNPRLSVAHNNLGIALVALGKFEQAIQSYQSAVALEPGYAEAHGNLGNALKETGRFDDAIAQCQIAISLKPHSAECHNQLGAALAENGDIDEAISAYNAAIKIDPSHANAYSNMGNALAALGRVRDAISSCEKAVQLRPESVPAHWNFAIALLRGGDFERGWIEHEWRLRPPTNAKPARFQQKAWDGKSLRGKTILLHAEQGFGDTIQFVRYVPLIAAQTGVGRLVLECHRELSRLFYGLPGVDQIIPHGDALPHFDEHIPLMSLPLALRTRRDTIPASIPYLQTDESLTREWKERVADTGRADHQLHVGLCWAGNAGHRNDRERSIPFADLLPLAREGIVFHSLHTEPAPASSTAMLLIDHSRHLSDFAQTAALLANLDHVITVDTAVAHLSGALGIPTSVLLPMVPDWRWMLHRQDSAWYPAHRLYRQKRAGRWPEVVQRIARALGETRQLARHPSSVR